MKWFEVLSACIDGEMAECLETAVYEQNHNYPLCSWLGWIIMLEQQRHTTRLNTGIAGS